MDNIFTIKERILQLAKGKGFTIEDFCKKIDISYANLKGKAKLTPINSNSIANILSITPDINLNWLITGNGEMLIKTDDKNLIRPPTDEKCSNCEILEAKLIKEESIVNDLRNLLAAKDEIIAMLKTKASNQDNSEQLGKTG